MSLAVIVFTIFLVHTVHFTTLHSFAFCLYQFFIQKCTDTVRCLSQFPDTFFAVFAFDKLSTFIDIFQCCHCHMNCIIHFCLNLFFQAYIFFISWNHLVHIQNKESPVKSIRFVFQILWHFIR